MNPSGRCIRHVRAPHVCYQLMSPQARSLAVYGATGPGRLLIQQVLAKGHFVAAVVRNQKLNKCKLLYYQRELPVKYSELRLLNLNCS